MAITYVGGKLHKFAGTASATAISLTDLTGGSATAPAYGDVVIVAFATGSPGGVNLGVTTAGYSEEADIRGIDDTRTDLSVNIKRMGATPDTIVTVSGTGGATNAGQVAIQVWRGVDSTTTLDVAVATAIGSNSCRANPPTITPTTAGAVVIGIGAGGRTSGQVFTSGDLSNFLTDFSSDDFDAMIGIGSIDWTAGAVDPAAFGTATDSTFASWAAVTLVLRPGATQALTPSLVTNSQTFFGPTVTVTAVNLSPPLLTNSQTFHGPAITVGAVTLAPSLITNTQTFFSPFVTEGVVILQAPLLTNTQTFFAPTISVAGVDLQPSLLTNSQTFFAPSISLTLSASLFTNETTIFEFTISQADAPLVGEGRAYLLPAFPRLYVAPGMIRTYAVPAMPRSFTIH